MRHCSLLPPPSPGVLGCRGSGERGHGARPGAWGFPPCLPGPMLSPGAAPAAPRFAGRAWRAVSQGDRGQGTAKSHPRGCGERAAAPLAEKTGQGTAPCFPRHRRARPPPRGWQGSTQNPMSGQGPRCSQLHLTGETPPAAKPLQTPSPSPFPQPWGDAGCVPWHQPDPAPGMLQEEGSRQVQGKTACPLGFGG